MNRFFLCISLCSFLFFSAPVHDGLADPLPGQKGKSRKKILHMQEIEILGNVEKPKAMFIIPRTPHQYYTNKYKRDFSEEILRPITKQGLSDRQKWQEAAP